MQLLSAHVAQVSAEYLDAMETSGGPLDLLTAFAYPIPALVICELLGVPDRDRPRFQRLVADLVTKMNDPSIPLEQGLAVFEQARHYMRCLAADKRNAPTDDLLSELTAADLDEDELTGVAVLLLIGGFDTTANMLALGTFALLRHPEQLAALRADPGLAERAVEELMRYLTLAHTLTRSALTDVEVSGQVIKAGETVALSARAANRDPARFPDPDTLDLRRNATGHLGFGHGVHQCLGQQLARVELRIALPALLSRFPTLRLAIPPNEVPLRPEGLGTYGVQQLPVTW